MAVLVLAGAASFCSPGTVLKEDPSVGAHPAVCSAVRVCVCSLGGSINQRSATGYPSLLVVVRCCGMDACMAVKLCEKHCVVPESQSSEQPQQSFSKQAAFSSTF